MWGVRGYEEVWGCEEVGSEGCEEVGSEGV